MFHIRGKNDWIWLLHRCSVPIRRWSLLVWVCSRRELRRHQHHCDRWVSTAETSEDFNRLADASHWHKAMPICHSGGHVILDSPVLPVMEGDDVTLSCREKTSSSDLTADFYKDGLLMGSSSTGNMTIHSVSKSDEGFYKCSISGAESPDSRLTVTGEIRLFLLFLRSKALCLEVNVLCSKTFTKYVCFTILKKQQLHTTSLIPSDLAACTLTLFWFKVRFWFDDTVP